MGFASLLSEISSDKTLVAKVKEQQKRQQPNTRPPTQVQSKSQKPASKNGTNSQLNRNVYVKPSQSRQSPSSSTYKDEDPAVRRLKEARRKEREKREAANPKLQQKVKKRQAASSSSSSSTARKSPSAPRSHSPASRLKLKSQSPLPPKKVTTGPNLSFKDLMKQAESIDTSKMSLTAVKRSSSPSDKKPPLSKALQSIKRAGKGIRESRPKANNFEANDRPLKRERKQLPSFAKPSSELLRRLQEKKTVKENSPKYRKQIKPMKQKRDEYGIDAEDDDDDEENEYGYYSDDYGDEDGFIVDDEEEEEHGNKNYNKYANKGYNREEIWNMFGKKSSAQKRHYYDDYGEEDDMEATGAEIFEEEERALKQAKLDDKREQQLLERRAAEKKKSLSRK